MTPVIRHRRPVPRKPPKYFRPAVLTSRKAAGGLAVPWIPRLRRGRQISAAAPSPETRAEELVHQQLDAAPDFPLRRPSPPRAAKPGKAGSPGAHGRQR